MKLLDKWINTMDYDNQAERWASALHDFTLLLTNKPVKECREDINLLEIGNNLFWDSSRVFPKYDKISTNERSKKRINEINNFISIDNIQSYCDVGCGRGEMPITFSEITKCRKCVGIDINADNLPPNGRNCEFYQIDLEKDKYPESFDLVTSYWAFEHFNTPDVMLHKMSELTAVGGYLYVDFSPIWNSADGHHMYRNIQFPYFHLIFEDEIVKEYCKRKDFDYAYPRLNKLSLIDFILLFVQQKNMQIVDLSIHRNCRDYYFVKKYPCFFEGYSDLDLLASGMRVILKKI